jgi:hypothetical protein
MPAQTERRVSIAMTVVLVVGVIATGCSKASLPTSPSPAASAAAEDFSQESAFCVQEINRLRGTVGASPLARTERLEQFANEAARVDTHEGVPHTHFRRTNGGNGTARAENTIPWWNMSHHGSVRSVIRAGLEQMWSQGPGGVHFENLRGNYTEVGCGIFVTNDEVTVSQDFR